MSAVRFGLRLVPQPLRGPVDEFPAGTERGRAGALIVRGHGVPLGRRSGRSGEAEPVQRTSGNTINTAAEKLVDWSNDRHGAWMTQQYRSGPQGSWA